MVADATGLVKVGYSQNTKRRMGGISHWCPPNHKPIRLIAVRRLEDRMARSAEKIAHEFLGNPVPVMNYARYEWFRVSPETAIQAVDRVIRLVRRYRRATGTVEKHWKQVWKHWPRRRGVTIKQAVDTINAAIAPRKVSAGWLYANVK